ncbi:MAG: SDR family oxidoreductase [Gemmataceae bacterium]|nr:SDR family oxidoreductase [Gemmataceae bacterium]
MNIAITGATRGLGRALVAEFARHGHTVHGCGRSADHIAALAAEFPAPHSFHVVDIADDAAVAARARACPTPDLLINNAALMNDPAPLWEIPAAALDRLMAVNVLGTMNTVRHFVPGMVKRGTGIIVNLSSGWGRSVSAGVGPYCTSKWATEGLTKSLAADLPAGLAAVALNPGVIDTDMLRQAWADEAGGYIKPARWATNAVPFLLLLGPADNGKSLNVPGA